MSASSDDGICDECETAPATLTCLDCELVYCEECSADVHIGKMKGHTVEQNEEEEEEAPADEEEQEEVAEDDDDSDGLADAAAWLGLDDVDLGNDSEGSDGEDSGDGTFFSDEAHIFNTPDSPDAIIFATSGSRTVVRAAIVEKLVAMLTHPTYYDLEYQFCFLATFPSFLPPLEFVRLLGLRMEAATPKHLKGDKKESFVTHTAPLIRERVTDVLCAWIRDCFSDFANDDEVREVLGFLVDSEEFCANRILQARVKAALKNQERLLEEKKEKEGQFDISALNINSGPGRPKAFTAESFSKALFSIEGELYCNIQSRELLDLAWNGKKKEELAPNVLAMIRNSTRVSYLVAGEIIAESKAKGRAKMIRLFIEAAEMSHKMENYNATVEICAGLSVPAVHRLSKSWKLVPKETQATFEELVSLTTEKNYAAIRQKMESTPACIPYLGVLLTDLTFITEANPKTISSTVMLTLIPKAGVKKKANFDGREPVQKLLDKMLKTAGSEVRDKADEYVLCVMPRKGMQSGQYLDCNRRLYEYEIYNKDTVTLVPRKQPLKYAISGDMKGEIEVDQSSTVEEILMMLSREYGFPEGWFAMEVEGRVLSPELPLWQQGVSANTEVDIKGVTGLFKHLKKFMDSAVLVQLLFEEHMTGIISGATPIADDVAIELCLLHIQAEFGNSLQVASDGKSVIKVKSVDDVGEPPLDPAFLDDWHADREGEVDWFMRKYERNGDRKSFREKREEVQSVLAKELKSYKEKQKGPAAEILELAKNKKAWKKSHQEIDLSAYLPPDLAKLVSNKKEMANLREKMVAYFPDLPTSGLNFRQEARAKYVEVVKAQPTYGGEFFNAVWGGEHLPRRILDKKARRSSMFGKSGGDMGSSAGKKDKEAPVMVGVVGPELIVINPGNKAELDRFNIQDDEYVSARREEDKLVVSSRNEVLVTLLMENGEDLLRLQKLMLNAINFEENTQKFELDTSAAPNMDADTEYINFSKSSRTGKVLQVIQQFQKAISKETKADANVVNFVRNYAPLSEDRLYDLSTELEKPSN